MCRLDRRRGGKPLSRQGALVTGLVLFGLLTIFRVAFGAPTVKIGMLLDLSGSCGEQGRAARRVSEMAVDAVNAEGGVAGQSVELTAFDTRGDPILGKDGARQLVSVRKVSAVVGPAGWATAMMTKPFFEEAEIPVMMLTWEDSVIRGGKFGMYEWIFQLPLRRRTALERIGAFVREKGWTRVGLVTTPDALGREAREWFERSSPVYGIEEVATESFIPTADMRTKLFSLANRDPQVIVIWCPLPHAATVARLVRRVRMSLPLFQYHEISPQRYVEMTGPAARQSLMVSNKMLVWEALDDRDPQKQMIGDFFIQYRDVYRHGDDHSVSPFLGYVWDSIMILVHAMRRAGTDGTRLRDAIERIHRYVGVGGVYGFTHEDHNGLDPESVVVAEVDGIHEFGRRWVGSWRLAR